MSYLLYLKKAAKIESLAAENLGDALRVKGLPVFLSEVLNTFTYTGSRVMIMSFEKTNGKQANF